MRRACASSRGLACQNSGRASLHSRRRTPSARQAASDDPRSLWMRASSMTNNHPLGPDEVGELVLRGPSMSSGYFNNPEASAIDDDGWFHTGDLATVDAEGYFFIVDRKKDMFISGGENIYPAEIEQALYGHPAVHMCAVIGVPDEQWGDVGKAIVVLHPNTSAIRGRLARSSARESGALQSTKIGRICGFTAHFWCGKNPETRATGAIFGLNPKRFG